MIFVNAPDSFDETYHTLPFIYNSPSMRYRRPMEEMYFPPPVYPRMIENRPIVYERDFIDRVPYGFYRSYEDRVIRTPTPTKKSIYLPKHSKKLVQRFLNDLENAHGHQDDDDCDIDGCEVCRELRSSMDARRFRSASDGYLYRGHRYPIQNNLLKGRVRGRSTFHDTIIKPTQSEVSSYPTGYTTFVDPKTGLAYAYDPNWQYNPSYTQYKSHHGMSHTPIPVVKNSSVQLMDKATYTRMTSEKKTSQPKNTTVVVHAPRNPTPRTPKVIIEQVPRQHRRKPRRYRSTTIVKERVPHTKTTTYIRK